MYPDISRDRNLNVAAAISSHQTLNTRTHNQPIRLCVVVKYLCMLFLIHVRSFSLIPKLNNDLDADDGTRTFNVCMKMFIRMSNIHAHIYKQKILTLSHCIFIFLSFCFIHLLSVLVFHAWSCSCHYGIVIVVVVFFLFLL